MKISPISITTQRRTFSPLNSYSVSKEKIQNDVFVSSKKKEETSFASRGSFGIKKSEKFIQRAANFVLNRYRKFSPDDYKSLNRFERGILNKVSKDFCDDAYIATLDASKLMKTHFDAKYGKDKYVFVSIGRSLEAFANAMGYMGVESKTLPISGLHGYNGGIKNIISQDGFEKYCNYLKQIGIEESAIKASGKKYIFSDYSYYGDTMRTVKDILKSLGIKGEQVEFVDFEPLYFRLYNKSKKPPKTFPELMHLHLGYEYFKIFATTKSLNYQNLSEVYDTVNAPQSYNSKLFNYKLMKKLLKNKF